MVEPSQTLALPLIVPGWAGTVVTVTPSVRSLLVPQELLAVTVMSPPVASAVALIDVVVELPVHPDGKVQVYEVAPGTEEIL